MMAGEEGRSRHRCGAANPRERVGSTRLQPRYGLALSVPYFNVRKYSPPDAEGLVRVPSSSSGPITVVVCLGARSPTPS
jgi:hypothetical protein